MDDRNNEIISKESEEMQKDWLQSDGQPVPEFAGYKTEEEKTSDGIYGELIKNCKTTGDIERSLSELKSEMPLDDYIGLCVRIEQHVTAVEHCDTDEEPFLKASDHELMNRRSSDDIRESGYSTVLRENLYNPEVSGYYMLPPEQDIMVARFKKDPSEE